MREHYTVHADKHIDQVINDHLSIISQEVESLMGSHLIAVILTGGFGRGEGSVKVDNDGNVRIINDYDVEVVFRERWGRFPSKLFIHVLFEGKINRLAQDLADRFDIKQIDLTLCSENSYARAHTPRLSDFDLRYGNKLLYGTVNPVHMMPEYRPEDIPVFEGTWLLRNRGIGLLLASFYLNGDYVKADKLEYFYIEIIKSILAMGDALFISAGKYHNSYAKRASSIADILPSDLELSDRLAELYHLASSYKLNPRSDMFPGTHPGNLWNEVASMHCQLILYYESKRLGISFLNCTDYARWAETQPSLTLKQRFHLIFDMMRGRISTKTKCIAYLKLDKPRNVCMTLCLLTMLSRNEEIQQCEDIVSRLTSKCSSYRIDTNDKQALTREFLLLIHPTGELGHTLGVKAEKA